MHSRGHKSPLDNSDYDEMKEFSILMHAYCCDNSKNNNEMMKKLAKKPIMFYLSIHLLYKYPDVIYVNDLHRYAQIRWTTALPLIENCQDIDEIEIFAYTLLRNPSICGSVSHSDFDSFNAIVIKNLWQTHAYT